MRATVVRDVSRSTSSMPMAASHSELRRISSGSARRIRLRLLDVGGGVRLDLLLGEPGPGRRPARRVADLGGEVADDEHGGVAELLELAQLAQDHREAEVDVGGGRVDPELDPERATGRRACAGSRPR